MGIRRWLSGTLRPDDVETDSITADSATVNGTTTTNTLEAEEGQITNETFVRAVLSDGNRALSSGTWTNLVDTKKNDVRGELDDTSFHLNFDKNGVYEFVVSCRIISGSSGDRLQIGIEDIDAGSVIGSSEVRGIINSSEGYLFGVIVIELSADTDYQVVVQNNNSSCDLITNISRYTVRRGVVQS